MDSILIYKQWNKHILDLGNFNANQTYFINLSIFFLLFFTGFQLILNFFFKKVKDAITSHFLKNLINAFLFLVNILGIFNQFNQVLAYCATSSLSNLLLQASTHWNELTRLFKVLPPVFPSFYIFWQKKKLIFFHINASVIQM